MKIKDAVVRFLWYEQKGRNKVVGRLTQTLTPVLSLFTLLKVYGISLSAFEIIVYSALAVAAVVIVGALYARYLLHEEVTLDMQHNHMFVEIHKAITGGRRK